MCLVGGVDSYPAFAEQVQSNQTIRCACLLPFLWMHAGETECKVEGIKHSGYFDEDASIVAQIFHYIPINRQQNKCNSFAIAVQPSRTIAYLTSQQMHVVRACVHSTRQIHFPDFCSFCLLYHTSRMFTSACSTCRTNNIS